MNNIELLINEIIKQEIEKSLLSEAPVAPRPSAVKGVRSIWDALKAFLLGGRSLAGKTQPVQELQDALRVALKDIPSVRGSATAAKEFFDVLPRISKVTSDNAILRSLLTDNQLIGNNFKQIQAAFRAIPDANLRKIPVIKNIIGGKNVNLTLDDAANNLHLLKQALEGLEAIAAMGGKKREAALKVFNTLAANGDVKFIANTTTINDLETVLKGINKNFGQQAQDLNLALRTANDQVVRLVGDGGNSLGLAGNELVTAQTAFLEAASKHAGNADAVADFLAKYRLTPVTKTKVAIALAASGAVGLKATGADQWVADTFKRVFGKAKEGPVPGQGNTGDTQGDQGVQGEPEVLGGAGATVVDAPTPRAEKAEDEFVFQTVDRNDPELKEFENQWAQGALQPGRELGKKRPAATACKYINPNGARALNNDAVILYQGLLNMGVINEIPKQVCGENLFQLVKTAQKNAIEGKLNMQQKILEKNPNEVPEVIRNLFHDKEIKLTENKLNLSFGGKKDFYLLSEESARDQMYKKLAAKKREAGEKAVDGIIGSRTGKLIAMYGNPKSFEGLKRLAGGGRSTSTASRKRKGTATSSRSSQSTANTVKGPYDLLERITRLNSSKSYIDGCGKKMKPRIHFNFKLLSNADEGMREGLEDYARMKKQAEADLKSILIGEKFKFKGLNKKGELQEFELNDQVAQRLARFAKKVEVTKQDKRADLARKSVEGDDKAESAMMKDLIEDHLKDDPLLFYRLIFYKNGDIQYDPDEDIIEFIRKNGVTWLNRQSVDLEDQLKRAQAQASGEAEQVAFKTRLMKITLFSPNESLEFNDNIDTSGGEAAIERIEASLKELKALARMMDESAGGGGRRISTRYFAKYSLIEPISGQEVYSGLSQMQYEGTQGMIDENRKFMSRSVKMFKTDIMDGRFKTEFLTKESQWKKAAALANTAINAIIRDNAKDLGLGNDDISRYTIPFYSSQDFIREELYLDPDSRPINSGRLGKRGSSTHQFYAGILNDEVEGNVTPCRPLERNRFDRLLLKSLSNLKGNKK